MGYQSLESLFNSLKAIENVTNKINQRKMILADIIGNVKTFDEVINSTLGSLTICANGY